MKAFVTGATGFIGQLLVTRLLQDGHEVVVLTRSTSRRLPPQAGVVLGDILDPQAWADAGKGCNRLYHQAGLITFDPRRREELIRVNGLGTAHVLAAARRWGVERSVIVSSATTVGISYSADRLMDESDVAPVSQVGLNPYLASKLETEKAALLAASDMQVTIVNPTTVFGPNDWSLNSGTLIRQVAHGRIVPVPPGGSNVVDVEDVVVGILLAGEKGVSGRRYILGGENLTFKDILATIADTTGRRPLFVRIPNWGRRPAVLSAGLAARLTRSRFLTPQIVGDLFAFKYFSSRRSESDLGWRPRFSFGQSVRRAWDFYQNEHLM